MLQRSFGRGGGGEEEGRGGSHGKVSLFKERGLMAGGLGAFKAGVEILTDLGRCESEVGEGVGVEQRGSALASQRAELILIGIHQRFHQRHLPPE